MSYSGNTRVSGKILQSTNEVTANNTQTTSVKIISTGTNNLFTNLGQKKQVIDPKRIGIRQRIQTEEVFPPVIIHRVDSSQHRQKVKINEASSGGYNPNLTSSLYARPNQTYNRGQVRNMSTSVDKTGSNNYLNMKGDYFSSNQSDTNRASYRLNVPTYKNEGNNLVTYGGDSQNGSNDGQYKAGYVNQRLDNLGISNRMVSSIISRQSNEKGDGNYSSKNKQTEVYQLYSSRHPNQSIRRSTIQISKAMSQNAIAELQRQNQHKEKRINKLQKEKQQYQANTQKWEDIKHRYQMDLESKSRQIIDLERANKRLNEEVQGIRAYRTMDTVQQVIIVRLKQQIMQLNKKIIQMRTQHYRNQQMLIEKHQKKEAMVKTKIQAEMSDKQKLRTLQQQLEKKKKQIQLLGVQLQNQKQKSWSLQKQRQQHIAQIATSRQALEKQSSYLKKQVITLKQEVQQKSEAMRSKDFQIQDLKRSYEQQIRKINDKTGKQLQQQKRSYQYQISSKTGQIEKILEQLAGKDKVIQQKLQQQKQTLQKQYTEQIKKVQQKVILQQQNKQLLQKIRQEKQQNEVQLRNKIAEIEQNLRNTNLRISQKDQQILAVVNKDKDMQRVIQQYEAQLNHLKLIINENQHYIREIQNENQLIKTAINERNVQIEHLRIDNMHIVQNLNREIAEKQNIINQQVLRSQGLIKNKFQSEFKQKQRQLEARIVQFNNQEQYFKQQKQKIQQQQQQQQQNYQAQVEQKQREKKQNQKWKTDEAARIQAQIKYKLESEFKQKEKQLQAKTSTVNALQQNIRQEQKNVQQLKTKLQQDKQAQLQYQLQQQQLNQKSQTQSRDRQIKERQKWRQDQFARMELQIRSRFQGQFIQRQSQLINQINILEQNINQMQYRFNQEQQELSLRFQDEQRQRERMNNQKLKQQQGLKMQSQIRAKLQGELKQKQRQLQTKIASVNSMQQNLKSMKTKSEQQQKVQLQRQQNAIRDLQSTRNRLTEQVRKLQSTLVTLNKQTSLITSKKTQLQSELALRQRQIKEIQTKNGETRSQLQASLIQFANLQNQKKHLGGEVQKLREAQNLQRVAINKEQQAKYNSVMQQLTHIRAEYARLEQRSQQTQMQLNHRIENENIWKNKSENFELNTNALKSNLSNLESQREQLKRKIKELQDSKASRLEIIKKYEQLLPDYQLVKQKLKLKEDQITGRENAYVKLKQYTDSTESKVSILNKQIRSIQSKIEDNQNRFRILLNKVEQQQQKYQKINQKLVGDSETYLGFIKELQQQNQFLALKYWKIRKLVRKQKITQEHEIPQRHEYGVFYKFLENQVKNHFTKVLIPAFKSKMSEKLSNFDSRLITQLRKISQLKNQVQFAKRKRAAERARSYHH